MYAENKLDKNGKKQNNIIVHAYAKMISDQYMRILQDHRMNELSQFLATGNLHVPIVAGFDDEHPTIQHFL